MEQPACRKKHMPHGICHHLGVDTHDVGGLEEPLAPGWVLAVEPAIYIPKEGFRVRLEDDILITDEGPTKLALAVAEVGRIDKTLHALSYLDDAEQRRRILSQLNRSEERHRLARAVFHGKRGELRQRYHQGQEDQLGVLGLVVNVLVLWNTLYLDAALDQLQAEGHPVRGEDVARLSPLGWENVNLLGRYAFSVPDEVLRGELRALRDPTGGADETG